jgi:hypothetical protein
MLTNARVIFSLEALRDHCDRCGGRHVTTLHYPRKVAANAIGRGETVEAAAAASGMPESLIGYWSDADAEFRASVEHAHLRYGRRKGRKLRGSARVISTALPTVDASLATK